MIVQKYGGTSVGTAARIRRVSRRIAATVNRGEQVVAVVSAMGHTTDRLIALAQSVNPEPPARELDMLVANGETITAPLVAMCLEGLGIPAISLSGLQAGVRTSAHHSRARIQDIDPSRILEALREGKVPVVAGFQGVTEKLEVTTLGRGGSDTTAVALAAALKADSCEIYTDVDGIFTADPRVVKSARKLTHIGYDEMLELAAVGARVMHPRAVEIGELYNVPIHVRSSFHFGVGTMIVAQVPVEERQRVRGIAQEKNVAKITVIGVSDRPGVAAAIFEPLGQCRDLSGRHRAEHRAFWTYRPHLLGGGVGPESGREAGPSRDQEGGREERLVGGRHRQAFDRRHRDAGHAGHRRSHVSRAGRCRHQHRDDQHFRDPHHLPCRARSGRKRRARPAQDFRTGREIGVRALHKTFELDAE